MKKIAYLAAALVSATVMSTSVSAQVTLRNGSFETIGQQYSPALGGLHEATDWVNTSNLNIQASSAPSGVEGTPSASGARFLRLVSDSPDPQNTGSIFQNLGTITAGQIYTISGTAFGGDSANSLWGGVFSLNSAGTGGDVFALTAVSGLAMGVSTDFSFGFAGTAATAGQSLFLRLIANPSADGQAIRGGVDNIQLAVAAVPEPTTWAMMIGGFGMVGGAMRRRKSKVTTRVAFA